MTASSRSPVPHPLADVSSADSSLARIVRNSAFNAVGTMLILPFNFVALFTLARRLGAESLGTFFSIFAIAAVIHWIADAGTTTVLTRRVARAPADLRRIVAEATGLLLVVCTMSMSMFLVAAAGWMAVCSEQVSWSVLLVAAASMATRHALDFAANVFRGLERFEFENLARVVQTAGFCLFVVVGVYPETGGTLAGFVAFVASNLIAAALIWAILLRKWHCAGFRLNRLVLGDWLRESIPLGFGDAIRQLLMQCDTLLLATFQPVATVGLFGIAARPLQPLQLLPRIIVSVTFPMMSRAAHTDRATLSRAFAHTTNLLWVASLPICILVSACARPLILATAGAEFADAAGPLQLLIWATGLVFINAQLRFVLTALDAERRYWRLISRVLVAKVLMELVLIYVWGLYGACLGYLLGEVVLCVWGLFELRRLNVAGPAWSQLMRAVPAAIAMAAVLVPFMQNNTSLLVLGLAGVVSMLVFAAGCLLTGAWPWSDVMRVWQAFRRRPAVCTAAVVHSQRTAAPEVPEGVLN